MGKPWEARQACEKEIGELSRKRDGIARTIGKQEERLREIAEKASRDIATVIIDGNNLLYNHRGSFVGEEPLLALVPELLARHYRVRVFFDPSVQKMLGKGTGEVERLFGENVEVVIAPSITNADQMIFDEADGDSQTYVISCDRYLDYPDRKTVKGGRLLMHRIMDGSIQVPGIDLRASFANLKNIKQ